MVPDVSLLYILQLRETGNSHSVPPDNRGVHKSFVSGINLCLVVVWILGYKINMFFFLHLFTDIFYGVHPFHHIFSLFL